MTAEAQKLEYQEEKKESVLERMLRRKKGIFHYPLELAVCFLSISLSIYHLFVAYAGSLEAHAFRSTHLAFVMILCFLMRPLGRKNWTDPKNAWFAVDLLCALLTLAVQVYTLWDLEAFIFRRGDLNHGGADVLDQIAKSFGCRTGECRRRRHGRESERTGDR